MELQPRNEPNHQRWYEVGVPANLDIDHVLDVTNSENYRIPIQVIRRQIGIQKVMKEFGIFK